MEIGFGELLNKFEEYFGRFWTQVVLGLAGLAFATFCMRVAWDFGIKPLISLLPIESGTIAPAESIWLGLAFAVGAGIGTALVAAFLNWRIVKRIEQLESKLREVADLAEFAALAPPPHQF